MRTTRCLPFEFTLRAIGILVLYYHLLTLLKIPFTPSKDLNRHVFMLEKGAIILAFDKTHSALRD